MSPVLFFLLFFSLVKAEEDLFHKNQYSFYLFENQIGCVRTFKAELEMVKRLQEYRKILQSHKSKLEVIKQKWHHGKSKLNPIDSFKRLVNNNAQPQIDLNPDFQKLKNFNKTNLVKTTAMDYEGEWFHPLFKCKFFPNCFFSGALNGILLLQDTYEFEVREAVKTGRIAYFDHESSLKLIQSGEKLTKNDLLDLAKLSRKKNLYDRAIIFMQEAKRYTFTNF